MFTPRQHAVLMTLAGMTVGVAVFGGALWLNREDPPDATAKVVTSQTPTPTPSRGDGLQPDSLQYAQQPFGDDGGSSAEVPTGWKRSQAGEQPQFSDPTGVWRIRFNLKGSGDSPDEMADRRGRSIDEPGKQIVSQDNGTLIYTYQNAARGPRMGLSHFVAASDGSTRAEITVGGRPQDEAALRAVLDRAVQTLQLPVEAGDNRPN